MKESEIQFVRPQINEKIRRNSLIFFFLTVLFQIMAGLLYGFFIRPTPSSLPQAQTVLPYFLTFLHSILVVIGFGLLLSFVKENIWSGLGFTLFITAMTLQQYFLINALWSWAGIAEGNLKTNGAFVEETPVDQAYYFFTLSDSSGGKFGNTMSQAFKCALANIVAFSAIIGRGGHLEAFLITFFGTIGFELNRTILTRFGFDGAGTMSIFIYGGFLGLLVGLILRFHERREGNQTFDHPLYTANKLSATLALLGSVFAFVTFPVLALDPKFSPAVNDFTSYTAPLSIVFAMSASTFTSLIFSQIYNEKLIIRDIVYGPIAGGVASATASFYIVNPVYSILIGIVAGFVQISFNNLLEKQWANKNNIINTTSFILFGVQGLIGCFFAAGWNAVISNNPHTFTYIPNSTGVLGRDNAIWQFVIGLISSSIGIVFGIGIGIIIYIFSGHTRQDHFTDHTYWVDDDGISFQIRASSSGSQRISENQDAPEIDFKQGDHEVKNRNAYL